MPQPLLTLGNAAKIAGVSKPTLSKAIKNGKLSADRREDGSFAITPSELERWKDAYGHRHANDLQRATPDLQPETGAETPANTMPEPLRLALAGEDSALLFTLHDMTDRQRANLLALEVRKLRDMLNTANASAAAWQDQAQRLALPAPEPVQPVAPVEPAAIVGEVLPMSAVVPTPEPVQPVEGKTPATGRGFWSLFGRGRASA